MSERKPDNAIIRYFRATWAEMRRVHWPTLKEGWSMTKIVLAVTVLMAVFLGLLDFFFGSMLGGVIAGNILSIILGVVVLGILLGAAYLISQAREG